ncbi:growth arrest-specific protein 1 isoform X2 [Patella vulgata]|uniref:growth arrest-specific protein 1 isoform X2 n=1 Tax=Patella vulgata TaxID=6465 RepID=UPI0021806626|nr:growth arrest-specific protein 1 isoform X2 [Patella vulgata]
MHVRTYSLVICVLAGCMCGYKAIELCDTARLKCSTRDGCRMALINFFVGCNEVIHGETNVCTTDCKHALISLLLTEDKSGMSFINCNCSGNKFCEERKVRVEICTKDVLQAMANMKNNNRPVRCNLAQWICEADTSCLTALDYYARHCGRLLTGDTCSSRCNNSLEILYRQKNAKKLPSCYCDGTEDYNCQKLKYNTEKFCFLREPLVPYVSLTQKPLHPKESWNSGGKSQFQTLTGIELLLLVILVRLT